jgi:DNA-binding response OmpR family regulator
MTKIEPGRFTRAAVHNDAGEVELRLSAAGNWQLYIRASGEREWRFACSGGLESGAIAPQPTAPPQPLRLGKLLVDPETRRVLVDGEEVRLGAREFALLTTLATQPNRVFTVEELQRRAFGYERAVPSSRTVGSHACRLRAKLRQAGAGEMVVNCHGVGYRLWEGVELASVA